MENGNLPFTEWVPNAVYRKVNLEKFSSWASSLGWELPQEFPHRHEARKELKTDQAVSKNLKLSPATVRKGQIKEAIERLKKNGITPAGERTVPFCTQVRDSCNGWADSKKLRCNFGFGDKTIMNIFRETLET